jgi:hypothetical protein
MFIYRLHLTTNIRSRDPEASVSVLDYFKNKIRKFLFCDIDQQPIVGPFLMIPMNPLYILSDE